MIRRVAVLVALVVIAAGAVVLVRALRTNEHGARVLRFTIDSRLVHASLPEVIVIPPHSNGRGRPLLVFLHGKGSDGEDQSLNSAMFAALAAQGTRAPDVVFPDGGDDSYWHNRSDGAWASYVMREVIPRALALSGADPHRIAIGGISMGGFGAYDIARLHPGRFCGVGGHSAALWPQAGDTAAGAFDDAADFARNDLIGIARTRNAYGRTPLWLDAGTSDPFHAADDQFARELRRHGARIMFTSSAGGHSQSYWEAHWGAYMAFYARALADCHVR
jgi:S-formylglutathione hydrolase FrmB